MKMYLPKFLTLLLVATVFFPIALKGQEPPQVRDRANQYYLEYNYAKAIPLYLKMVDQTHPKLMDLERLADMYFNMNQYEAAENWYSRVVQQGERESVHLIRYGEVLKINGRYAEAKLIFERYDAETGDSLLVANSLAGCDSAMLWMASPTAHQVVNQYDINTPLAEFSLLKVGQQLYYTGEPLTSLANVYGRTGNGYLQVYHVNQLEGSQLTNSEKVTESWNQQLFHVGPISSNQAGTTLFVTRTYPGKQAALSNMDQLNYRTQTLELLIFEKDQQGNWQGHSFAHNNTEAYSLGHASLSPDEDVLYYISDRPNGYGGTDVWYSERLPNGEWGLPVNAGKSINSKGDELFPILSPEGLLYYSSTGIAGMGGLDIFSSQGNRDQWTKPENLKYPINSASDDFSFFRQWVTPEREVSFLSSNRKGGVGGDDIYLISFQKPAISLLLEGVSYDKSSAKALEGVSVTLLESGPGIKAKQLSSPEGGFAFQIDPERDYLVLGQKTGYYSDSTRISTIGLTSSDTLFASLYLEPILEVGKTISLTNIYYDFDRHTIRKDAAEVLDELVRVLRDNPTMNIELASHTDSRGADLYNLQLSQRRAQAAVDYLVKNGIARDRLTATGYGETQLVNSCGNGVSCSVEAHQKNRRTTFTVLGF